MTPLGWIFTISTVAAMIAIWALSTALAVGRSRLSRAIGWTLPVLLVGGSLLATFALYAGTVIVQLDATLWQVSLAMLVAATLAGLTIAVAGMRGRAPARSWPMRRLVAGASALTLTALVAIVLLDRARLAEISDRRTRTDAARAALVRSPTPDQDAYRELRRLFAEGNGKAALDALPDLKWPMPPAGSERDRWVATMTPHMAACGPLLDQLERTARLAEADFGFDPRTVSFNTLLPELSELRSIARIASIDAQLAAARGDRARALERCVQIDQVAEHVAATPTMIHQLVAFAIRSLGTATVAAIAADVDVDDPRLFSDAFDRSIAERIERSFVIEHAMVESLLLDAATRGVTGDFLPDMPEIPPVARPLYRLILLPTELRSLDALHAASMEAARVLPKPAAPATTAPLETRPAGLLVSILASTKTKVIDAARAMQATPSLRRALQLLHGTPPEAWKELKLPIDPLSPNGSPLRLLRDTKSVDAIIVYTVGANGVDDGGPQDLLRAGGGSPATAPYDARSGDDIGVRFSPK
jgi:hypothetical protein